MYDGAVGMVAVTPLWNDKDGVGMIMVEIGSLFIQCYHMIYYIIQRSHTTIYVLCSVFLFVIVIRVLTV